jgi:hypothetical protein
VTRFGREADVAVKSLGGAVATDQRIAAEGSGLAAG